MKRGELRRWNFPEEMPAYFGGAEIFMITRVIDDECDFLLEDDRCDFLINGQLVKSWSRNWICKHSKVIDEAR